ncbi:AAA family ATPase [Fulvivirga kasyanovii]
MDDNLLPSSYKLDLGDFNRSLGDYRGHWIIISLEFSELSDDEAIQSLFVHGAGQIEGNKVSKATYNLFFRPKADVRFMLSELEEGDVVGLNEIRNDITLEDYETFFTGKSTADFNDPEVYKNLVGDFDNVRFTYTYNESSFGVKIPHQLSVSKEVSFTFIKALRDVVSDFHNNRTNPLITLLKSKSNNINKDDYRQISETVISLNSRIEDLPDVQQIRADIKNTIKDAVGQTYSPSSLSINSSLPSEADKLLQSLKLLIGEPGETYEGGIHELSLGGANLIFLTLKLLEYKYQIARETFANFLLIEEPEAHIHTHIQKTLFDKLDFGDTQIIYSTHSTQISEVSNVENINILGKKENYAEVYQPSIGLQSSETEKIQRYLDAVRSNLLFAKGVILVEGDAEEILIPTLVKSVMGVSLDELGISLINIRSTGFKNVAQLFHNDRIRRRCAIVTDSDHAIMDTTIQDGDNSRLKRIKRRIERSAKKGAERRVDLDTFCNGNEWVKAFYAEYTFEVDFVEAGNYQEVKEIVDIIYTSENKKQAARKELDSDKVDVFGRRVLTMANKEGKGWFALLLGKYIYSETILPDYLVDAILFAKGTFSRSLLSDILTYRAKKNFELDNNLDFSEFHAVVTSYISEEVDLATLLSSYEAVDPSDQILCILRKLQSCSNGTRKT